MTFRTAVVFALSRLTDTVTVVIFGLETIIASIGLFLFGKPQQKLHLKG